MEKDSGVTLEMLKVDGAVTANNLCMLARRFGLAGQQRP